MQNLNFNTRLEVKFVAETGEFEGYASVFNVTDKVNDKIVRGAFKASLAEFNKKGELPLMLWQHNTSAPIGRWLDMYEDEHGLFVKGQLFVDELNVAKEAYKLLKEKLVTGLSIGYRVVDSFKEHKDDIRVLTAVDLQEISLVTFPANEYARVSDIKRPANNNVVPTERELEATLRTSGLSRRQAKSFIALGYKGLRQQVREEQTAVKYLVGKINNATEDLRLKNAEYKFDLNQTRVAAGNSNGGQWTSTGAGDVSFSNAGSIPMPKRRPKKLKIPVAKNRSGMKLPSPKVSTLGEISSFFRGNTIAGHKLPFEMDRGDVAIGAASLIPVGGAAVAGVRAVGAVRRAYKLSGHLKQARKIPKGVKEVSKGEKYLNKEQVGSLKRFKKGNTKFKHEIESVNYSDGRSIFTFKKTCR